LWMARSRVSMLAWVWMGQMIGTQFAPDRLDVIRLKCVLSQQPFDGEPMRVV